MNILQQVIHYLLPFLSAGLLIVGIKTHRINFLIAALWLALIALLIQYQASGREILGHYFDYQNAALYTISLLVLIISLMYLFLELPLLQGKLAQYISSLIFTFLSVSSALLMINLWMNAYFIENKRPGTPIMQVASLIPLDYCPYKYVFYKIGLDGKISYLCPNHYGIIPTIGHLDVSPDFVLNHLIEQAKGKSKVNNSKQ